MTWNFRIIKAEDGIFGIYEVFYDSKGRPEGCTQDPILTGESRKDLLEELKMMKKDCEKTPVLSFKEFKNSTGNGQSESFEFLREEPNLYSLDDLRKSSGN